MPGAILCPKDIAKQKQKHTYTQTTTIYIKKKDKCLALMELNSIVGYDTDTY